MTAEQWEEAEEWIRKGIVATEKRWPSIAVQLRAAFSEMQEREDFGTIRKRIPYGTKLPIMLTMRDATSSWMRPSAIPTLQCARLRKAQGSVGAVIGRG
ncbi:MAG: hypothetical protein NW701_02605 [Nitrospira sp.]